MPRSFLALLPALSATLGSVACGSSDRKFSASVPVIAFDPVITVDGRIIQPDSEGRFEFTAKKSQPVVTLSFATPCGRSTVTSSKIDTGGSISGVEFPREPFATTSVVFDPAWTGKTIEHLNHTIEERVDRRAEGAPELPRNYHYDSEVGRQSLSLYFADCERAITIDGRTIKLPEVPNTGGTTGYVFVAREEQACYLYDQIKYGSGDCPSESRQKFQGAAAYAVTLVRKSGSIHWFERYDNKTYSYQSCATHGYFNPCP